MRRVFIFEKEREKTNYRAEVALWYIDGALSKAMQTEKRKNEKEIKKMDYQLIKCPYCGSTSLTASYYDESQEGGDWKLFLFGWIGLAIAMIRGRKRNNTFWDCNNCGAHFMDVE